MARRLRDLHQSPLGGADPRSEHAVVDRRETNAADSPAGYPHAERTEHERGRTCARPRGEREEDGGRKSRGREPDPRRGRCGEAETERATDRVRRSHPHGITSPFSCASLPGPIPGTPSSSATEWNGPCFCR